MKVSVQLFLALGLLLPALATPATTEQLRQWIMQSRKNLPEDGEGDLAGTILRLFGFGNEKEQQQQLVGTTTTEAATTTTEEATTVPVTTAAPIRDVCPFGAEPLMLSKDFSYCRPSAVGDCPVGYLCDQSFVLGRSICCRDMRNGRAGGMPNRPAVIRSSSPRPVFSWNTVTPTQAPARWNGSTKKAPWYIKDRTQWPTVYNRITETTTTEEPTTTEAPTTTTTEEPTTTTEATTTPTTTTTTPSTTTTVTIKNNPWNRFWTSTVPPKNIVNVSVLQSGSVRTLRDGQIEAVGAITLINDNGFYVLVDTGASSDTERLLFSLSKESVSLKDVNTVVITHAHPGHMGNINFFGEKPILFHSMEYIGRHVSPTELKERPYRKLSQNVEVWKTPGHTQHDLTVLIHNVAGYGTMAIAGDLIPNELLISNKEDVMAEEGVWDANMKRQNANLIICMADWIVPGHGQPFKVLPHYRQRAGCTRLLAERYNLNRLA